VWLADNNHRIYAVDSISNLFPDGPEQVTAAVTNQRTGITLLLNQVVSIIICLNTVTEFSSRNEHHLAIIIWIYLEQ
jgi:hypothetical protein